MVLSSFCSHLPNQVSFPKASWNNFAIESSSCSSCGSLRPIFLEILKTFRVQIRFPEPGPNTSYGPVAMGDMNDVSLSNNPSSTTHRTGYFHPIPTRHASVPNPNLVFLLSLSLSLSLSSMLFTHSRFQDMGRGRVQLKQIENKISRQVTFSKRRTGLRKKAHEISVLCDAQVALIVFNAKGKLFEYSSESSMENVLERYERHTHIGQLVGDGDDSQGNWSLQCFKLTGKVEVLERNLRNFAGQDLDPLNLRELQSLEHQLDTAIKRIRTRKNQVMNESISDLHKKAKLLQEQNGILTKKIKEKGKAVAEPPQCEPEETLGLTCPPELQLQQRLVPSLTLGETLQATTHREMVEARTVPSANTLIPPWMLHHFAR
ncbi:hypothetical protein VNO78_33740 [Psophocarpus tetragonolobus]|uniref:Uncharacterized protein n=1 Tax=Psophocarpus tetragonolobus TaxID=3891 RepID=A0AAN9NXK3_PSOTE